MDAERWQSIDGFPNYAVSTEGRVKSAARWVGNKGGTLTFKAERVLRAVRDGDGYLRVNLYREGRMTQRAIHQLVLEAFVGTRPAGTQTLHGDGDRACNLLSNLRWGTAAENTADRTQHGNGFAGERNAKAKLTADQVLQIREDSRVNRQIAADFGVDHTTVSAIKRGEAWAHVHCP